MKNLILFLLIVLNLAAFTQSNSPNLLWHFDTYLYQINHTSHPILNLDGNIILINEGSPGVPKSVIHLFSPEGDTLLSQGYDIKLNIEPTLLPTSGKVITGKKSSGVVYCINPNAEVNWMHNLGDEIEFFPVIDSVNNIYLASLTTIYSLDSIGQYRWELESSFGEITTPLAVSKNGTIFFGVEFGYLMGVSNSGSLAFSGELYGMPTREPSIDIDGSIYICSFSSSTEKNAIQKFNLSGELIWTYVVEETSGISEISVDNNYIYFRTVQGFVGDDILVYKVNKFDLEVIWTCYYGPDAGGATGITIAQDGTLYFASRNNLISEQGGFFAINADGTIQWKYTPGDYGYDWDPIGYILIGKNGNLYGFASSDSGLKYHLIALEEPDAQLANAPWPMFKHDPHFTGLAENIVEPQSNIVIDNYSLEFPFTEVNGFSYDTIAVQNTGTLDLTLSFDINSDVFEVSDILFSKFQNNDYTIEPGSSLQAVIRFAPTTVDIFHDTLMILSNDPDQPVINVLLSGKSSIEGDIKWEVQLDEITSGPAIDDFINIYVAGSQYIWSIDSQGTIKWDYETEKADKGFDDENVTISADNRFIYVPKYDDVLCLDSAGNYIWDYSPQVDEYLTFVSLSDQGHLYFADRTHFQIGKLYCLKDNGQLLWELPTGNDFKVHTTITLSGDVLFTTRLGNQGTLYSYSSTGELNWQNSYPSESPISISHDGVILIGGYTGNISNYFPCISAFDKNGELIWETEFFNASEEIKTSIVVGQGNRIYFCTTEISQNNARIYCLSQNGNILWHRIYNTKIFSTPALAQNGMIYFGAFNGKFHALTPDGSTRWVLQTGAAIKSSPAIDTNGIIYFTNDDDKLFAVYGENGGLAKTAWPMIQHDTKHTSAADSLTTSISKKSIINQLSVFPNPAKKTVHFNLPKINLQTNSILVITDIHGRQVASIPLNSDQVKWDASPVPNGIYFYRTELNGELVSGKIIINN